MDSNTSSVKTYISRHEANARAEELERLYPVSFQEASLYVMMDEERAEEACKLAAQGYRMYEIKSALLYSGREIYSTAEQMAGWIGYQKLIRHSGGHDNAKS